MAVTRSETVRTEGGKSCTVRVAVSRAEPLPDRRVSDEKLKGLSEADARKTLTIAEMQRAQEGPGDSLPSVDGLYLVSHAANSSRLEFSQDYVAEYAAKVEQDFVELATRELCNSSSNQLDVQITFVELSFFDPFDLELLPRYGRVVYDQAKGTVYGLFIWNPRQILADQYWLHTRQQAPGARSQIELKLFSSGAQKYEAFLSSGGTGMTRAELALLPDDLEWLFSQSISRIPPKEGSFARLQILEGLQPSAERELAALLEQSARGYAKLTAKLATYQLARSTSLNEPSLSELAKPELEEQYKYKSPMSEYRRPWP